MKEDILEQLVDDYLMHEGYFTRHNIRFKPVIDHPEYVPDQDRVGSDIDVIGLHPHRDGHERVIVASCKAWQHGFDPARKIAEIEKEARVSGREAWRGFRELVKPKWASAFVSTVEAATGSRQFTYWTVVTRLRNAAQRAVWEQNPVFVENLQGNPIRIVTLTEMLNRLTAALTTTPAASEIGRALQLMRACGWHPSWGSAGKETVVI